MKRFGILLLLLAACAQPQKNADQPAFRAMGEPVKVDETRSDESIGFEVRRQIELVGPGAATGIVIQVNDGVVTLTGSTSSLAASWRAQGAAQAVKGVKTVVNQIATPTLNTFY